MMSYPLDVLENMPELKGYLEIPENHYIGAIMGFGYAEISYARGVSKADMNKVHRILISQKIGKDLG